MSSKQYKLDNPTAVIGELAKRLYAKYGDDVLPIFAEVLKEYGRQTGIRLRGKMGELSFPQRVTAWLESLIKTGKSEIAEALPDRVTVKGYDCPLNLEGSSRDVCCALMRIDEGLVGALGEKKITMTIEKTMSAGDEYCLVTFQRQDS